MKPIPNLDLWITLIVGTALAAIGTKFPDYWGDLVIVMEVQDA